MELKKYLIICLLLGFIGVFLIIYGSINAYRILVSIGAIFIIPMFLEGLRGKEIKRMRLINYIKRKIKVFQN